MALIGLAPYQARAGDIQGAMATANQLPDGPGKAGIWRGLTVNGIVAGQAVAGDVKGALASTATLPDAVARSALGWLVVEVGP